MLGYAHVTAATTALVLAMIVLALHKGTGRHRKLGRQYVAVLTASNIASLRLREESGALGPFHVLAVVSLLTLAGGMATSPRIQPGAVAAHARFMLWSAVGLSTAGLAQLANSALPQHAPLPVLVMTCSGIAVGAVAVPKAADRSNHG